MSAEARTIRTRSMPSCPVCASAGAPLYSDLEDRSFGAPGSWNLSKCSGAPCGTLWLDPAPIAEDLGLAYAKYYTHGTPERPGGVFRRVLRRWAMEGFFAERYGYRVAASAWKRRLARGGVRTPELREWLERLVLLQPPREGGRALDVGCGEGRTVAVMASLGWQAEGVDFDGAAVEKARARDLNVRQGTLEDPPYPAAHFDVVGMSHVIEHVPEPLATLRECRRILKPGGQLVLVTPNVLALGHRRFGRDWRGLEPPRHLQVFTPEALRRIVADAGLTEVSLRSSAMGAAFLSSESRRIAGDSAARPTDAAATAFAHEERAALAQDPWAGEELVLVASP